MNKEPVRRCALCRARGLGPFCALSGRDLEHFERQRSFHLFRRGQHIFTAGNPATALYVIRSGRVKVYTTWQDGEEQVLRLLGPGEILGYRPLFADEVCNASAETLADAEVCVIPEAVVRDLVRTDAELAFRLLRKLAQEMRISEGLMMSLLRSPVRQRVARLLLRLLADNRGAADPAAIVSRELLRKDMARMVGTTPETFSRVLRSLAQAGAVSLTRGRIRVRDQALLNRIAGERPSA